jgi:hypothetical protein
MMKLAASETEAAGNQTLNDSPDSDVFQPLRARVQERIEGLDFFQAARHFDALSHLREGDIDGARQVMQRLAYLVFEDRDTHPEQVAQFTALMVKFVQIDPLFGRELNAIKPVVRDRPGILQTELYSHMDVDQETARYVLYFAHETGQLARQKKGRTYAVYLPEQLATDASKPTWAEELQETGKYLQAIDEAATMDVKREHLAVARRRIEDVLAGGNLPNEVREKVTSVKQTLDDMDAKIKRVDIKIGVEAVFSGLEGEKAAALVATAQRIGDLPNGNRSVQELADEHRGWKRAVAEQRGNATFYESTPAEQHIQLLGRLATKLRKDSIGEAVACLRRQRELARAIEHDDVQTVEWWLRLPKYLQTEGRTDEALAEIESLIDHDATYAKKTFAHRPEFVVELFEKQWCAQVCAGAALICARAGRTELQQQYERRGHAYATRAARLREIVDAHEAAQKKEYEIAQKAGGQALHNLFQARAKTVEENKRRNAL